DLVVRRTPRVTSGHDVAPGATKGASQTETGGCHGDDETQRARSRGARVVLRGEDRRVDAWRPGQRVVVWPASANSTAAHFRRAWESFVTLVAPSYLAARAEG